jgi:hypothetical protein
MLLVLKGFMEIVSLRLALGYLEWLSQRRYHLLTDVREPRQSAPGVTE